MGQIPRSTERILVSINFEETDFTSKIFLPAVIIMGYSQTPLVRLVVD